MYDIEVTNKNTGTRSDLGQPVKAILLRPHLPHLLTAAPTNHPADHLTPGWIECNAALTYQ